MAEENAKELRKQKNPVLVTLIIVVVVALLEGGGFFLLMKVFGSGPGVSYGAEEGVHVVQGVAPEADRNSIEVQLFRGFKVPNNKTGRTIIYDFDITIAVSQRRKDEVDALVKAREGEMRDRLAQIVRQARPRVLEEDDFATLRNQMKRALDEISGAEDMVQRVLIPRCMPIPAD